MKKTLVLLALLAVSSGCVATRNIREVRVQKDADGKVIKTECIERQEQRCFAKRAHFKCLTD
ncbi:MAG: hypothetical protein WCG03_10305 [Kiritimatiellales bacterium]